MTGLWDTHHKNIKANMKNTEILAIWLFISTVVCVIGLVSVVFIKPFSKEINLSFLAVSVSLFALTSSLFCQTAIDYFQTRTCLTESIIWQKQDKLNNIKESIELFYLPLNDLLTTYNENNVSKAKTRKINEINGHRYLAQPRVRCIFEEYIQSNGGANRESNKLLELVRRDIKFLQNRFMELNMELKTK